MTQTIKILLVEDTEDEQNVFKESLKVFNDKNPSQNITYIIAENLSEAKTKLDGSFDGAIIDLKLGDDKYAGNKIVTEIHNSLNRIPLIFYTAFPELVDQNSAILEVLTRGDKTYEYAMDILQKVYNTGITRIMGGRGTIEHLLQTVFTTNILPQIENWKKYGEEDPEKTEQALLRHALNHLIQQIDEDCNACFPEEFYLYPLSTSNVQTGSVVKEKTGEQHFVILTPACDLFIRKNGKSKTDHYLLVEIESKIQQGTHLYYHCLPKVDFFAGGTLNFRKLKTIEKENFNKKFELEGIQISSPFIKDIVARFSSYYARQGQPAIDASEE